MSRRLLSCLLLLGLVGCQAPPRPESRVPAFRLAPADFRNSVSLAQRLRFEARDPRVEARSLDAVLEIDVEGVRLAGLALGQRILSLDWDGRELKSERHPALPAAVNGEHVLRDVQLVYWPTTVLRRALPEGWTLADDGAVRTLSERGDPVAVVRYAGEPRWQGRAELDNRREGYRLIIESTVQSEAPQP